MIFGNDMCQLGTAKYKHMFGVRFYLPLELTAVLSLSLLYQDELSSGGGQNPKIIYDKKSSKNSINIPQKKKFATVKFIVNSRKNVFNSGHHCRNDRWIFRAMVNQFTI